MGMNRKKTEEYIKQLTEKQKSKGVSNNLRIGINTIKEAYDNERTAIGRSVLRQLLEAL